VNEVRGGMPLLPWMYDYSFIVVFIRITQNVVGVKDWVYYGW